MTAKAQLQEDGPPNVEPRVLRFPGGHVDLDGFVAAHPGGITPTTIGAQSPAKMRAYWLRRAFTSIRYALEESDSRRMTAQLDDARVVIENAEVFDARCQPFESVPAEVIYLDEASDG
jgi:hypothetical protein